MQRNNQHKEFATSYGLQATGLLRASRGVTVVLVLAFMGIFALILGTITSYVFEQGKYGRAISAREQALHIAEAGLEYYKWRLSHSTSTELTTGTALISPYTYAVNDPEGGTLGNATITATPALQCGAVQWIDLESKGTSNSSPGFPRTLLARYMKPSVAEYSYIVGSNVWAGSDRQISGPYHSNGGIRMDGTNNSDVTSKVSSWTCDSSFGCSPSQSKPGIFGAGSGSNLWKYPVSDISFTGMAVSFPALKTYAQTSGIMLNPTYITVASTQVGSTFSSVGSATNKGFHLVFRSDGKLDVYRVTSTSNISALNQILGWMDPSWGDYPDYDHPDITGETKVNATPISIPSGCALIFSQAKTWIEGTVSGKVTVIAADTGSFIPDIMLPNNISYATLDGTSGLTAVAEGSVLISLIVPDAMSLRGVFVAQTGLYGRNLFDCDYVPNDIRTSLTMNGSVISNARTGTQWSFNWCTGISGFRTRIDNYDRLLAFSPPPFTPSASVDYKLNLWREK